MKPSEGDKILVLGGYGTFGQRIVRSLCQRGHQLIINGRNRQKAEALKQQIMVDQGDAQLQLACFDVHQELAQQLQLLKPALVIHTCGPFQGQDTQIAQSIISAGIHYIDLADGRDYVQQLLQLDGLAKQHGVSAITAASTVPALSSAAIADLQQRFQIKSFQQLKIGISPGQRTDRGFATAQAVLSYVGKPLKPWPGNHKIHHGWQDMYLQKYPTIGSRLMGNCEAADLDLLQQHFPIDRLGFAAGMESKLLHVLIWLSSWLVRSGFPIDLTNHTDRLLKLSRWFDFLGSTDGGMHIEFTGLNAQDQQVHRTWSIEAKNNTGPQIPATPAILMAEKILQQQTSIGVKACVNTISLNEYLGALDADQTATHIQ